MQASSPPAPGAGSSSNGPNDNLLAIAMEYRQSLGSTSSSRANTPRKAATPPAAPAPRAAATPSPATGPNDSLLAIALAERAKAGKAPPRRAAAPSRQSVSPPKVRASPTVSPFVLQ